MTASANSGKKLSAISRCTRRVSIALQTDGRDVLAFTEIFTAISISALESTYIWQLPAPVSITGTFAFSTTERINPRPPRGISASI